MIDGLAYAIDRLTPVLLNLASNGQSWRENGIPVERVKALNGAIGDALPEVWEHLEAAIDRIHAAEPLVASER
jgi:putative hydrolase of HD superfamily